MTRAKAVENLTAKFFSAPRVRTIGGASGCGRALRVWLRLIASRRSVESLPLLTPFGHCRRDRSSLRRNHWRARVPDRGDARQQPVAGPIAPRPGDADGHDALLWPDARRSRTPDVAMADAGTPALRRRRKSPPIDYIDVS